MVVGRSPIGLRLGGGAQFRFLAQVGDAQHRIDEAHGAGDAKRQNEFVGAVFAETGHEEDKAVVKLQKRAEEPESYPKPDDRYALPSGPALEKHRHVAFSISTICRTIMKV